MGFAKAPVVKVFDGIDEMCESARVTIAAFAEKNPISVALSGGSTPRRLYEQLHAKNIDILKNRRITFIMGDERLYGVDNEQSNYRMAYTALLHDVPTDCVFPVDPTPALLSSESASAEGAKIVAENYAKCLFDVLPVEEHQVHGKTIAVPIVDVVLLGFGSDGHTASIFPDSIASTDAEHAVSISFPSLSMTPKVWRVTLTPHVIQHAKHVIVLAGGKDKNWVVRGILEDAPLGEIPVARFLRQCKGHITFLLDRDSHAGIQ